MYSKESLQTTSLAGVLVAFTLARLLINGVRRFPYVVLTPMALALGVERAVVETALSLLWLLGLASPFAGPLIDRLGRKRVMLLGVGSTALFTGIAALGQSTSLILFALVATGIGKILYDPAMQAYIGDRTPYARRGMAIGITELAWSGSLFIFGPLAALLIAQGSLNLLFGVFAAGSICAFLLLTVAVPGDKPDKATRRVALPLFGSFQALLANRSALALLAVAGLISLSMECVAIVYEAWLRDAFLLTTIALGALAWVLSAAEVGGEGFVIAIADRFGKRRLAVIAIAATGLCYLAVPLLSVNAPMAVVLLFALFLCFEISVVVLLPMLTEALPEARGTMMSTNIMAFSVGRAIGTVLGGWMFRTGGLMLNGVVALAFSLVAVALVMRYVQERQHDPSSVTP